MMAEELPRSVGVFDSTGACNLSWLISIILCDSGEKEPSDQWQSLSSATFM